MTFSWGGIRSAETELLVYTVNRYMRELTEAEQRLQGVYDLVLGLLAETRPGSTAGADPTAGELTLDGVAAF